MSQAGSHLASYSLGTSYFSNSLWLVRFTYESAPRLDRYQGSIVAPSETLKRVLVPIAMAGLRI